MSGLFLLVTGPADESKRMKRVQGWSRLNWLGGIFIVNALFARCCFVNQVQGLQFLSSPINFKSIVSLNR